MSDLIVPGLTPAQHTAFAALLRRPQSAPEPAPRAPVPTPPPVRVISLTSRTYDSTESTELPAFVFDRNRTVWTVRQRGNQLSGYFALILNDVRYIVECRRETLDDIAASVPGLRITVFPGLWEFDFGPSSDVLRATVEAESLTTEEEDELAALFPDESEASVYAGSWSVVQEFWRSVPDRTRKTAPRVQHAEISDGIPYDDGSVCLGAVGLAVWSWDAGYLVTAWQCRQFSHEGGYQQSTDPKIEADGNTGGGGGDGGGGGGGGGGGPGDGGVGGG